MKMFAVRNLRLCTKDCLCLYVCPTGATDTENSVIDITKCTGCGMCAQACPSKAISMVPEYYPPQQVKENNVIAAVNKLTESKARQEKACAEAAKEETKPGLRRLMTAIEKSDRLINEDLFREAGYMLSQSRNTRELLKKLVKNPPSDDFPVEAAQKLLDSIHCNE